MPAPPSKGPYQTIGDAFNIAGAAAIEAGEDLLAQLGGEQQYEVAFTLHFEHGIALFVANGLLVLDERWRTALGITAGQVGEVPLEEGAKLPRAEHLYGLRVVEAYEGSLRLRAVPIRIRDTLNGPWMAAVLALIALGTPAAKVPDAVQALREDGSACKVTYRDELTPGARKFAEDQLRKLPHGCSFEFELKGDNGARVLGRVKPEA
jgi:hypothetical protein